MGAPLGIRYGERLDGRRVVYDFELVHMPSGQAVDGGRGFISEKSRRDAIAVAMRRQEQAA